MNRILSIILLAFLVISCNKSDDDGNTNNQNIPNITFDSGNLVNTNLPPYDVLQFPNNYYILNDNYGVNGVVIFYAGGTNYSAFELSDPNHPLRTCSTLSVEGVVATCNCDDGNSYEILSGNLQPGTTGNYTLKRYFVEVNGNIIRVYNN
jgi:hypothetical protein